MGRGRIKAGAGLCVLTSTFVFAVGAAHAQHKPGGAAVVVKPQVVAKKIKLECWDGVSVDPACLSWSGFPAYSKRSKRIVFVTKYRGTQLGPGAWEIEQVRFHVLSRKTGKVLKNIKLETESDHYSYRHGIRDMSACDGDPMGPCDPLLTKPLPRLIKKMRRKHRRAMRWRLRAVRRELRRGPWGSLTPVTVKQKNVHATLKVVTKHDPNKGTTLNVVGAANRVLASHKLAKTLHSLHRVDAWVDAASKFVVARVVTTAGSDTQLDFAFFRLK